jgi:AcrR family transcriptional regulator
MRPPARAALLLRLTTAAERIIEAGGLADLQARKLADDAACAVGSIYNVVKSMDEVILHVNARSLQILGDDLIRRLDQSRSTPGGGAIGPILHAMAGAYVHFTFSNQYRWRALFEHQMKDNSPVPAEYREQQRALFKIVEDALAVSIVDPAMRSTAARALFSAVHGILALSMDQKLGAYDQSETEAQVAFIIDRMSVGLQQVDA